MDKKQFVQEFEFMRNMAEIKVLSNYSLENPLDNQQFERMMQLKRLLFGEG